MESSGALGRQEGRSRHHSAGLHAGTGHGHRRAAEATATVMPVEAELAVDEIVEVVGGTLQQIIGLRLRDPAGLDRSVELRLRRSRQGLLEPVGRLPLRLGDLGERLARLELRVQLRLGQAEVLGRRVERGWATMTEATVAEAAAAMPAAPEERKPILGRAGLHCL